MSQSLDLFASTVPYYAAYRSGYPGEDIAALAAHLGLDGTQDAADIGCGTGQLAIPLARYVRHLSAIDPLEAMLAHDDKTPLPAGCTTSPLIPATTTFCKLPHSPTCEHSAGHGAGNSLSNR